MRLVYKFKIKESEKLRKLCSISKDLYNQANYIVRQNFLNNKDWVRYTELDKILKITKNLEGEINYRKLKSQSSQQCLKLLDKNWTGFFKSIKDWNRNKSKYKGQPKPPKYKDKVNILIFTNQNCVIKKNKLKLYKDLIISIPNYKGKNFANFQQVRILPKHNYMEVEIVYEQPIRNEELDLNKFASIDLGLNNLIAMIATDVKPLLINGNPLRSYNQFYNKTKAKLCAIKDKMGIKGYTNKLYKLEQNRTGFINDYLHKTSKLVINILIKNKIGTLVVGQNKNWKSGINIGKRNNQKFVQIPHLKLINYLQYKCELVGIKFITHEESYTSKCDSLVMEKLGNKDYYLGKRVKRGLFQSSCGKLINADINGSVNILRKVVNDSVVKQIINKGLLFNPVKIRNMFSASLQSFLIKNLNYS